MEKANKDVARIKELTELLNRASKAYYAEDKEIISNYEYDKLYDELAALEEETGIVLSASPTRGMKRWMNFPKRGTSVLCFPLAKQRSGKN